MLIIVDNLYSFTFHESILRVDNSFPFCLYIIYALH